MATPLTSATEAYLVQQQLAAAAVVEARRVESRGFVAVAQAVAAYQLLAAQQGAAAVPQMLAEQGLSTAAQGAMAATALAGVASNGLPLVDMLDAAADLGRMVATFVADAGRQARATQMAASPAATHYARMLNPPSCSRCVILAGVVYKWDTAIERHPQCDCVQIPSSEALAGDLTTDPMAYFESLPTTAELEAQYPDLTRAMRRDAGLVSQEDVFTTAGAEAIRLGADMNQVVNARSGMSTAQVGPSGGFGRLGTQDVFGRQLSTTKTGTTSRGRFGAENAKRARQLPVRLMPESIIQLAEGDRDEAVRLLRLYGYLL